MITKIQKWGNSQGIRVPKSLLEQCHISIGEELEVLTDGVEIRIKPVSIVRGRYKLNELVRKIPKDYKIKEEEWGSPKGKEAW